ncbi:MAG TPA: hypothetical protein VGN63_20920 [Flavisolibacter sp.]|jgi:hypothetical protein|nr:hypothetical protein [Flavisolibacter sp.]
MGFIEGVGISEATEVMDLRKKSFYPIGEDLRLYLKKYEREVKLPVTYDDLYNNLNYSVPLKDHNGNPTEWEKVIYDIREWEYLSEGLIEIYAILKTKGDPAYAKHWRVESIDYCPFGNSNPFRVKILNQTNNNHDLFYVKKADASRIYGLELEHLLSPHRITYFTYRKTLIEEHIPGIPGDIFIRSYLDRPETDKVRFAKEFVKFNERCFVRLLGDMRSYNFVVNIMPDVEGTQYRVRAIDFDQQCYEGKKNLYRPQFFKDNAPLVKLTLASLRKEAIDQYQTEERTLMASRVAIIRHRLYDLLNIMAMDELSTDEKTNQLKQELAEHFSEIKFLQCQSMGDLVKTQLKHSLQQNLCRIQEAKKRYAQTYR